MRIAIVTPTYNEAGNIKKLVLEIEKACKEFVDSTFVLFVVDDNSPDGTAKIAEQIAKKIAIKNLSVEVLLRKNKDGIGKAYVYGLNEALKRNFDYIIQIDADLQHNPKYIKDFVREAALGSDFVAASRYMKGGEIVGWGLHRRILSLGANIYTRAFLGSTITDYTNGLNMFSTELLRKVDISKLNSTGYGFFIELKYSALNNAKKFVQVPITLAGREHGESKIAKNTILINLLLVPRLRFRSNKKT